MLLKAPLINRLSFDILYCPIMQKALKRSAIALSFLIIYLRVLLRCNISVMRKWFEYSKQNVKSSTSIWFELLFPSPRHPPEFWTMWGFWQSTSKQSLPVDLLVLCAKSNDRRTSFSWTTAFPLTFWVLTDEQRLIDGFHHQYVSYTPHRPHLFPGRNQGPPSP